MEDDGLKTLGIGAIISLSSIQNTGSFVYTDGFIKDKIMLRDFGIPDPKNFFYKCLFQVYPSFSNTYKKEAQLLLDNNKEPDINITETESITSKKEDKSEKQMKELEERLLMEFKFNQESYKKMANNPVLFGQPIQFLHISSNKFLALHPDKEAEFETENYRLLLDDTSSEATLFKFSPCYRHQKDSEGLIYLSDNVYLESALRIRHKIPFIHFSNPVNLKIQAESYEGDADDPLRKSSSLARSPDHAFNRMDSSFLSGENVQSVLVKKTKKEKIEVNASTESPSKIKLNLFTPYIEDDNPYLCFGDVLWLNYSELGASLVVTKQLDSSILKVNFDSSAKNDAFKQFVGNTNGMWVIEREKFEKGGFLIWDTPCRFKHFSSGQFLMVKSKSENGEKIRTKNIKLSVSLEPSRDCLFVIKRIESTLPKDRSKSLHSTLR